MQFLDQETLYQGSVFLGRERTTDQDFGFSIEYGHVK